MNPISDTGEVTPAGVNAGRTELPVRLQVVDRPNDRHAAFAAGRAVTLKHQPLLRPDDVVFTMGSCFAEEIRSKLDAHGTTCVPAYHRIEFDRQAVIIDTLPDREHLNFYNTFTVLQQLEAVTGEWVQAPEDYWTIGRLSPSVVPWREAPNYQDPYLRLLVARTPELLSDAREKVLSVMREGFQRATAFVFTFGMAEVFISSRSGKVAGQKPAYAGGGGMRETERYDSTFADNLDNLRRLVRLVRTHKPDAPIVMSVSPVPLARTFGPLDVMTASLEGKSILRAALGQVVREFDRVAYLPSYEYVTLLGPEGFKDDMRHVRGEVVSEIVDAFLAAFLIERAHEGP